MKNILKGSMIGTLLLATIPVQADDFSMLLNKVDKHPNVKAVKQAFVKRASMAQTQSVLKDPVLKFSALNVPTSDLSFDKTPMSSRQVALAQSFPLSAKLIRLQDQSRLLAEAGQSQAEYQVRLNRAQLWAMAARGESLRAQLKIVKASLEWIQQVDKSTQRRYSTGKTNQINLFEIKVRKAELESQSLELLYQIAQIESEVGYLLGSGNPTTTENIPWISLKKRMGVNDLDHQEAVLQKEVQAAQMKLRATQLSYIPDLAVGAAYSFRENIDGQGDFVSGFVQLSLPFWGDTKSKKNTALAEANEKSAHLEDYKLKKNKKIYFLENKILALSKEIDLTLKSIEFFETEQKLATKRYSLGKLSIFELLEIELKLRRKKSKKESLLENYRASLIEFLLLKGDDLHA